MALGDAFRERATNLRNHLRGQEAFRDRVDVPDERLFIGLEYRLQQFSEALSGLEPQPHQVLGSARLDRKEATSIWIATAASPAVPKRPISFNSLSTRVSIAMAFHDGQRRLRQ